MYMVFLKVNKWITLSWNDSRMRRERKQNFCFIACGYRDKASVCGVHELPNNGSSTWKITTVGTNTEMHNWTLCKERATGTINPKCDLSIDPYPSRLRDLCGKTVRAREGNRNPGSSIFQTQQDWCTCELRVWQKYKACTGSNQTGAQLWEGEVDTGSHCCLSGKTSVIDSC